MIVLNTEDNLFLTKFKYSISYTKTYKSKEYVDDLFLETKYIYSINLIYLIELLKFIRYNLTIKYKWTFYNYVC